MTTYRMFDARIIQ